MPGAKVVWCERGWFPTFYGFCPSESAWRREMKRLGCAAEAYPDSDGRSSHFEKSDGHDYCIIVTLSERIDKKQKSNHAGLVGLIVHEAMHVWRAILRDIGEKKPSREFEAYAMQAITTELYKAYMKTRIVPLKRQTQAKSKRKRKISNAT